MKHSKSTGLNIFSKKSCHVLVPAESTRSKCKQFKAIFWGGLTLQMHLKQYNSPQWCHGPFLMKKYIQ